MSETITKNSEEKTGNRRFDYELGLWIDPDGKTIDQSDNSKKLSTYLLGKEYISMVQKNANKRLDDTVYYAEDLIKEKFPFLSLRRLKMNVTKMLRELAEAGIQVSSPLAYKGDILKAEAKRKIKKKKTILDLVAELENTDGLKVSKRAVSYAGRHTSSREDKLNKRYEYNTNKYRQLQDAGEVRLARNGQPSEVIKLGPVPHVLSEFKRRFEGSYTNLDTKQVIKVTEWAYNYFIKKQGRQSNLQSEAEFWISVTKIHQSYYPQEV